MIKNLSAGDAMTCSICGATAGKAVPACAICGHALNGQSDRAWDRVAEAAAYQDLSQHLGEEEAILAVTRGRLMGDWRPRSLANPRTLFTPYANVGLTGSRLLVQAIKPTTGQAAGGEPFSFPHEQIAAMQIADADALEPGRTVRLVFYLVTGQALRLRASGRPAKGAADMVKVWASLYGDRPYDAISVPTCPHCGKEQDRPHRFCPFCGKEQAGDH